MRAKLGWVFPVAAAISACQQGRTAPPIPPNAGESPQASEPKLAGEIVASLAGEWRVAAIDGRSLEESYGLPLRGDENRLWWEPLCAGMSRGYRIKGQSIGFSPTRPPRRPGEATQLVCAIGIGPAPGCSLSRSGRRHRGEPNSGEWHPDRRWRPQHSPILAIGGSSARPAADVHSQPCESLPRPADSPLRRIHPELFSPRRGCSLCCLREALMDEHALRTSRLRQPRWFLS